MINLITSLYRVLGWNWPLSVIVATKNT